MKNQSNAARNTTPAQSTSTASVPISVYRELAAELQATRAMVDSLNDRNQQLDRENLQLRQEVQRVVYSVLTLQPWVEPVPPTHHQTAQRPTWEETAAATAIAAKLRNPAEPQTGWLTEEAATPQKITQTKSAGKLGGLWLTITIMAIIVSAFGAGFLIMKPFLPTK